MAKEVKIVSICIDPDACKSSEEKLTKLINDGWEIITANERVVLLKREVLETSG